MQFDVERLIRLRRVSALAPAPNAGWVAVVVERLSDDESAYVSDLWRVPLDGAPALQLTRGEHDDRAPAFGALQREVPDGQPAGERVVVDIRNRGRLALLRRFDGGNKPVLYRKGQQHKASNAEG